MLRSARPRSAARRPSTAPALRAMAAAALIAALGCDHAADGPAALKGPGTETVSLTTIPTAPVGAIDIRGVVIQAATFGPDVRTVPGVRITVLRVDVDPAATDTATARKTLTPVGVATSGADGTFELRGVGRGYFALDAVPPAGSNLASGRAWSISLLPSDPARSQVYLYPR